MKKTTKRLVNSILSLALVTSLLTPAQVSATSTIKTTPEANTEGVSVTTEGSSSLSVHANITGADVISTNISWGSLVYSYSTDGWDPATLTSTGTASWIPQSAGVSDVITVDNRSNVPITATFTYQKNEDATNYAPITGTFSSDTLSLATAYKTEALESARKKSTTLILSGAPTVTTAQAAYTTIGYVTVSIKKTV